MRGLSSGIFLAAFAFFLWQCAPSIAPLDSTELAAVGTTLGIAHPPGYPLYSLAARAWSALLFLGNHAYRANVFAAACSAAAVALLAASFEAEGWAAALIAALTLLCAPAFRKEAVSAEVFALNSFLAALLVFIVRQGADRRRFALGLFVLALGLGDQQTLLLASPLLLALLPEDRAWARLPALAGAMLALGGSVYLFLLLRALRQPVLDWEQPDTLARFWGLVTRARYGTLALAQGGSSTPWSLERMAGSVYFYAEILRDNVGWLRLLALAGLVRLWLRNRLQAVALLAAWAFTGPAFFILSKMEPGENARLIMERFLPLSAVFVAAFAGESAGWLPRRWSPALLLAFVTAWPQPAVSARTAFVDADLLRDHLRTLPEPAVLIADRADEMEFAFAYAHLAEGRRPGLRFIDGNAGVTPSIYGDDYYGVWGPPRLARREMVESALIAASSVPVYYATLEPQQLKVSREREGLLWRAKGPARKLDWDELYVLRWDEATSPRERTLAWSRWRLAGEDALERGDLEAAERDFRGAALFGRDPAYELHWAGVALLQHHHPKEAARLLERALAYRSDPLAYSNLGAAREGQGDLDGALAAYRKAVQLGPAMSTAHRNLGAACWKLQEWDCAAGAFERAAELEPSNTTYALLARTAKQRVKK